jgi:hypothetical protein
MSAILFDTLKLARDLRGKGHFTPEQAEDLADAFGQATADSLATKTDIAVLESRIAEAKSDILKWVIGAIGFQTIVMVTAIVTAVIFLMKAIPPVPGITKQ